MKSCRAKGGKRVKVGLGGKKCKTTRALIKLIRSPITMTCCFPSSSHFQTHGEGPVGIWTGAIEYTTVPICRVNSWQPAGVCVSASVCVLEPVCVCVYSTWAVASSMNLCTIECDTTWWWEEPGALKWYVVMTAPTLCSSPGYSFSFSCSASFSFCPFSLAMSSFLFCLKRLKKKDTRTPRTRVSCFPT